MVKHELMIVADYSEASSLTLNELCEACNVSIDVVNELIEYDIIHPKHSLQNQLVIELIDLQRAKTALRLQHDLEVNLAGIVLVLDLLDEVEKLRKEMQFLEKNL